MLKNDRNIHLVNYLTITRKSFNDTLITYVIDLSTKNKV